MKNKTQSFIQALTLVYGLMLLPLAQAVDIVRFEKGQSKMDMRILFKEEVLSEALLHTVESHGPYELQLSANPMSVSRAIKQLASGNGLNVYFAITTKSWEQQAIPIRIPVRRGLLSYRLLLINKVNKALFENVRTGEDLKKLAAGLQAGWATTEIMQNSGFLTELGNNYDSMFYMLAGGRFDYLPRGVNEIFDELDQRSKFMKGLIIEPTLALYIPSPTYIFVSPRSPRLAARLQLGLEMMLKNGTLENIFQKYYAQDIKRANLKDRTIIRIDNPFLPKETALSREELWFRPTDDLPPTKIQPPQTQLN